MPGDLVFPLPGEHGVRRELGSYVGNDQSRFVPTANQRCQCARNAPSRDRRVEDRRQTFARHVVDDVQNAEASTVGELVVDDVQRPAGVRLRFDKDRRVGADGSPPRPTLAHREAFLAMEPMNAIDARCLSLLSQQDKKTTVSKPLSLVAQRAPSASRPGASMKSFWASAPSPPIPTCASRAISVFPTAFFSACKTTSN